jgi:hypothetical protein
MDNMISIFKTGTSVAGMRTAETDVTVVRSAETDSDRKTAREMPAHDPDPRIPVDRANLM